MGGMPGKAKRRWSKIIKNYNFKKFYFIIPLLLIPFKVYEIINDLEYYYVN